ncbi:MAG: ASKHA domain-containing protein, partial [Desulfarculaceae bacterium]
MGDSEKVKIIFQPSGRRGEVAKGTNIIEASRQIGVDIEALCGEKKVCGKCKVRIEEGTFEKFGITSSKDHVSPWVTEEKKFISDQEREAGFRLGCVAQVQGDLLVFVPEESRAGKQVVSKAARDIEIEWNPAVKLYTVSMIKPTFEDPLGDFERMSNELKKEHGLGDLAVDIHTLRQLPGVIRQADWQVTAAVWNDKEIIRVWPGEVSECFGLAIDVGTTTVAAYLCNLATMEVVDTVSMMNPQCKYGEDVMARITYHMQNPGGLKRMSDDLIEGLNSLVKQACEGTHPPLKKQKDDEGKVVKDDEGKPVMEEAPEEGKQYLRLEPQDLMDMTIGCNTAMHHILLQLDPQFVGLAPFPPVVHRSLDIRARDLGLDINGSSYVFVLSNEAGFVGADNVCVLVAEKPHRSEQMQLIIDIGTNGELVLGNKEKLISSSCATGPALEGAQLSCGMRAAPGAIERIKIDPETHEVDYKVIGREAWKSYSKPEEMQTKGI